LDASCASGVPCRLQRRGTDRAHARRGAGSARTSVKGLFECKRDGRLLYPHLGALPLCGFENGQLLPGPPPTASSPRTPKPCWKDLSRDTSPRSKASEVATGCRLNMDPKGKVVLITGSTDGVGRLVARRLADQGARILIHGRDRHRGKQVVDQIQRAADRALVGGASRRRAHSSWYSFQ